MLNIKKLLNSFKFAFRGIKTVFKTEQNFRIHLLIAILVLILSGLLQIRIWEWVVVILLIFLIFVLEMLNTVFERLVDMLKPRVHLYAEDIKNISSGFVLIAAISAFIIGLIIFLPYFF